MKNHARAAVLSALAALTVPATLPAQNPATPPAPAASAAPAAADPFKSPKEKLSYAIGMDIATTLKRQSVDVDPTVISNALRDGLTGAPTQLTEAQARETITAFATEQRNKMQAASQAAGEKAKGEGEKFLAENKTKEGVKTLPDGLQYKILKEGAGPVPAATDTVSVNYRGTLIDGTEFDSSYKRNEPASFPVNKVVKGWTEALQMMKVGSKYQLFLPAALAYGETGTPGGPIPPNSTLIFEVELLSIQGK